MILVALLHSAPSLPDLRGARCKIGPSIQRIQLLVANDVDLASGLFEKKVGAFPARARRSQTTEARPHALARAVERYDELQSRGAICEG